MSRISMRSSSRMHSKSPRKRVSMFLYVRDDAFQAVVESGPTSTVRVSLLALRHLAGGVSYERRCRVVGRPEVEDLAKPGPRTLHRASCPHGAQGTWVRGLGSPPPDLTSSGRLSGPE